MLRANEQSEQSPPLTFARNRFGEALPPFARLLALLADVFTLGRGEGGLCSFARKWSGEKPSQPLLVCSQSGGGKGEGQAGRREGVGEAKAERDDEAMDYLLKPSLMIVAGLTLGIAIATATAVAKIRIKQFLAIPLASKVVAGLCMTT
ncbi:MAG: hypothetical protein ACK5UC_15395 [Planctomycetaceae bacterium]